MSNIHFVLRGPPTGTRHRMTQTGQAEKLDDYSATSILTASSSLIRLLPSTPEFPLNFLSHNPTIVSCIALETSPLNTVAKALLVVTSWSKFRNGSPPRHPRSRRPDHGHVTTELHVPNTCIPHQAASGCHVASGLTSCFLACHTRRSDHLEHGRSWATTQSPDHAVSP